MSKVDIWMPIFIGDYLRDTQELTGPEHGAYLLLIMHYWQKKGEIGCDVERLARVCKSDVETARFILGYYFDLVEGNYRNKRADLEMERADNRRNSAKQNGLKGGRPPLENPQETGGLSDKNSSVPDSKPSSNPQESSSPSPSPSYTGIQEEREKRAGAPQPSEPSRFKKPTIDDVSAYCSERRNGINAQRFVDYYDSTGWKVGKHPMKDWKAAVRTWEQNEKARSHPLKVVERTAFLDIPEA